MFIFSKVAPIQILVEILEAHGSIAGCICLKARHVFRCLLAYGDLLSWSPCRLVGWAIDLVYSLSGVTPNSVASRLQPDAQHGISILLGLEFAGILLSSLVLMSRSWMPPWMNDDGEVLTISRSSCIVHCRQSGQIWRYDLPACSWDSNKKKQQNP